MWLFVCLEFGGTILLPAIQLVEHTYGWLSLGYKSFGPVSPPQLSEADNEIALPTRTAAFRTHRKTFVARSLA